jgi:hypothetical protein
VQVKRFNGTFSRMFGVLSRLRLLGCSKIRYNCGIFTRMCVDMKIEKLVCPNCGAPLTGDFGPNQKIECNNCATPLVITDIDVSQPIFCPDCYTLNSDEIQYCTKCGCQLQRKCINCDAVNRIDASYCATCGEKFRAAEIQLSKKLGGAAMLAIAVLAVMALAGISGVILSLIPSDSTVELIPSCLGLTLASVSAIVMIWLRNPRQKKSLWTIGGITAWFMGINVLGWGGFTMMSPGNYSVLDNLGYSLALCITPGIFLTLLGVGLYLLGRR